MQKRAGLMAIAIATIFSISCVDNAIAQQGQQPPLDPVFYEGRNTRVIQFVQSVNQALAVCFRTGQLPDRTTSSIESTATTMARGSKFTSLERQALRKVIVQNWIADYYCD